MNAVLFDNDGILADSELLHRVAWEKTFSRRGLIVSEAGVVIHDMADTAAVVALVETLER